MKDNIKISIVVWDCNFRESHHALDFFAQQSFPSDQYELIWVDFYDSNYALREKISRYNNFRLVTLNNDPKTPWHLGVCMNTGVALAIGDILILPDADIAVESDFLDNVYKEHRSTENLVLYNRRYDEPADSHCSRSHTSIDYLRDTTRLTTATNFGGCFSLLKRNFLKLGGYEEHPAFSGPGMNAMELNVRFRNAGYCIKWSTEMKVYHPWHRNSTMEGDFKQRKLLLQLVRSKYQWINPYAGLQQSWVYRCREINIDLLANQSQCEEYINNMPKIDLNYFRERYDSFLK